MNLTAEDRIALNLGRVLMRNEFLSDEVTDLRDKVQAHETGAPTPAAEPAVAPAGKKPKASDA